VTRKSLLWRSCLWIAGSVVGAAIVALPDSDERVFSFSRTHGPSPLDLLGVAVLVGSWLPIALLMPSLWRATGGAPARAAAATAALGAAGLVITIGADMGWVWLIAAAALVIAQIIVIADGWRLAGQRSMTRQ
jgi:hypothetical protein